MNTTKATFYCVLCYALVLHLLFCTAGWSAFANNSRFSASELSAKELPRGVMTGCDNDTIAPVIVFPAAGLQATLEGCDMGQPAVFFFSLTIVDECDPAAGHNISIANGGADGIAIHNLYRSHYMLTALPGSYSIHISATDASGNTRQEDFGVEVLQESAPGTGFGCNDTIIVNLDDTCQRLITPDMLVEGELGCLPPEYFGLQVVDGQTDNGAVVDGPGVFPVQFNPQPAPAVNGLAQSASPGAWALSSRGAASVSWLEDTLLQSVEAPGGWSSAALPIGFDGELSFDWQTEFPHPDTAGFIVQLLDADGSLVLEEYHTEAAAGSFQSTVNRGQVLWINLLTEATGSDVPAFSASVANWAVSFDEVDLNEVLSCWGTVVARDQRAPELICPPDTDAATLHLAAQQLSGTVTAQGPSVNPVVHSCLSEDFQVSGARFYDVIPFEADQAGIFTFFLNTSFSEGGGHMAIFSGGFSPLSPCSSILAQHDFPSSANPFFGSDEPYIRVALPLEANHLYYLVTITDVPGAVGSFTYTILPEGDGRISGGEEVVLPFTRALYCEDLQVVQQTDSLQWTGEPLVADNCGQVTLSYEDESGEAGDCGALFIMRTFTAADEAGNADTCTQQIDFRRPGTGDIALPPQTFPIDCNLNYPVDGQGNPAPSLTGYPFILTIQGARDLDQVYCNLSASYSDSPVVPVCEGSYQFLRSWDVIDWCDPGGAFTFGQIIKVGDFTAPTVNCSSSGANNAGGALIFPAQPFDCSGAFPVPLPEVTDNCSGWEVFTQVITFQDSVVYNAAGVPLDTIQLEEVLATIPHDAANRFVSGIPMGCHAFRYVVTDACDNKTEQYCNFCVEDQTEPVADCNEALHVSLTYDGGVRLLAPSVDEGSWDNCGIDRTAVRRLLTQGPGCAPADTAFSSWAPHVDFTCCDVDSLVAIELLVVDTAGNQNTCWAEVLVEDKIRPNCSPPADRSIACDSLPDGFQGDSLNTLQAWFGVPGVTDNCSATWEELEPVQQLDECGIGTIVRRFRSVDDSGNASAGACEQTITIEPDHHYEIKFPKDGMSNCGIPNPDTIEVFELACDLLAVSVTDTVFSASGDECYKIFRTYKVINWCEYDGESPPVLISRDEDCDELPGDEAVWVLRRPEHAFVDRDDNQSNSSPAAGEKGTVCDGQSNPEGFWRNVTSNGYWQYEQHVKVYDDEAPEILFVPPLDVCSINNETCRASAEYLFSVLDNCTPTDLAIEVYYDEYSDGTVDSVFTDIFGTYPKWKLDGDWPVGEHEFEIRVEDGCGNQAAATMPFRIVDCLAPVPTCINGLSTPLMPVSPQTDVDGDGDFDRGAATVFAEDLIVSPYTDCSEPVTYSINRIGEEPARDKTSILLTCDDLGAVVVEVYAWDSADNPFRVQPDGTIGGPNYDNCETFILVTNNLADCNALLPEISGVILREDATRVPDVPTALSGFISQSVTTDSLGRYQLSGLEPEFDYTVTPFLDGDDQNGLTTYDVVLISRHILGIDHLDSPYQLLAADVNNSGSVSTLDMILLRQVILSILVELPNGPSWRFVPAAHQFENPANPWLEPVPYSVTYNDLTASAPEQDYVAIKVGDIDLSAVVDPLQSLEERTQNAYPPTAIYLEDRQLNAGQRLTLPLTGDLSGLSGLQAQLGFDPGLLELEQVAPGAWAEHFYNNSATRLGISWNSMNRPDGAAPLLYLTLRARRATKLSDAVFLDYQSMAPESYTIQLDKHPVVLRFVESQATDGQLMVYPNPFSKETVLRFYAPDLTAAQLTILDQQGRVVWEEQQKPQHAGWQEWRLSDQAFPVNGLYFVRILRGAEVQSHRILKSD